MSQPLIFTNLPQDLPDRLLTLLHAHLPSSLTILRRLQFTSFPAGTSPQAQVVFTSNTGTSLGADSDDDNDPPPTAFTVAYLDFASGPDTQMWLYSTLQDKSSPTNANSAVPDAEYERQLRSTAQTLVQLRQSYGQPLTYGDSLLLGSLHTDVRRVLERQGRVEPRATGYYDKWLFRAEELPQLDNALPDGMRWEKASFGDCEEAVSNTNIPRRAELLVNFPSLTIKLEDNTLIAWAFLGPDGSLSSLFVKEQYRGRGLAKALSAKLFREGTRQYGNDGYSSSDVAADNQQSRGMCKSLKGEVHWEVSWILFDLAKKDHHE